MKGIYRFLLVSAAAVIMAVDINTFVHTGGLLPGGFSGISLLVQDIFKTYFNIKIPYSPIYWGLNVVPAAICFKYVGKKFTLYSIWMLVLCGVLTDLIPGLHVTDDILLTSVFGGILNGVSVCLCLFAGATSGGTDFISIFVSEKTGKTIWNYILIWDCFVLDNKANGIYLIGGSGVLKVLNVVTSPSATSQKSAVVVTTLPEKGSTWAYKTGATVGAAPTYGNTVTGFTALTNGQEIAVTSGHNFIEVVELDADSKAIGYGIARLNPGI